MTALEKTPPSAPARALPKGVSGSSTADMVRNAEIWVGDLRWGARYETQAEQAEHTDAAGPIKCQVPYAQGQSPSRLCDWMRLAGRRYFKKERERERGVCEQKGLRGAEQYSRRAVCRDRRTTDGDGSSGGSRRGLVVAWSVVASPRLDGANHATGCKAKPTRSGPAIISHSPTRSSLPLPLPPHRREGRRHGGGLSISPPGLSMCVRPSARRARPKAYYCSVLSVGASTRFVRRLLFLAVGDGASRPSSQGAPLRCAAFLAYLWGKKERERERGRGHASQRPCLLRCTSSKR